MDQLLRAELVAISGDSSLGSQRLPAATVDWTRTHSGTAAGVVRPTTTAAVSGILRACDRQRWPVVVQGGNTGLVAGGVPAKDPDRAPVILQTDRLDAGPQYHHDTETVTAGAGVTLAAVQDAAGVANRYYGVDLAARDQATIGGTIATNAGGIRVCAFGMSREQLVGAEFVLADGTVVSTRAPLTKDNTGYPLLPLLCGSEGTLAVLTSVEVRTWPKPGATTLVAVPVAGFDAAHTLVTAARSTMHRLLAAEIVDGAGWARAGTVSGAAPPCAAQPDELVLLLEIEDGGTATGVPPQLAESERAAVAIEAADQRTLWSFREMQTEAWSRRGLVHKFDVSLPNRQMDRWAAAMTARLPKLAGVDDVGFFGHIADGNLHLEVLGDTADRAELDQAVLPFVADLGGSISAEHGLGRAKTPHIGLRRNPGEQEVFRRLKRALDPHSILNPGVIVPAHAHASDTDLPAQPAPGGVGS